MYKVVFVDDEMLVKLGLRSAIDWEEEGFEIVGEASSGREGLNLITSTHPDLVISDIVMPEMDGIEMYQALKQKGEDPVFIALSSYDQFDLVKRVMREGARDYLLKLQLSGQSLHELLTEVRQELDERDAPAIRQETVLEVDGLPGPEALAESAGAREASSPENDAQELNRIYLYGLLLGEKINPGYLEHCFEKSGGRARVFYIASDASRIILKKTEKERNIYTRAIRSVLDEIAVEFGEAYCIEWEKGNFIIVMGAGSESEDLYRQMAEAISLSLENYGNLQSSIGISGETDLADLQEAYNAARRIAEDLKYNGYGNICCYSAEDTAEGEAEEELADLIDLERLEYLCERLNEGELQQYFMEFNFTIRSHRLSLETAAFRSTQLICLTEEYLKRNWEEISFQNDAEGILAQIYSSQSIREILRCNRDYVATVERTISQVTNHDDTRLIRDAKNYIKNHLGDSLGLTEIASVLEVSPSYLSASFSQKENIGIINYINREKVKRAQYLMTKERLKVYEVSYMLGFENASYFAKVFRKYTGCSPKQYVNGSQAEQHPGA